MKQTNQLPLATLRRYSLDQPAEGTLREHLTRRWRQAILDGQLPEGVSLPSTRLLATELGIGRSTVVEVIEQLALEGYVITRPGAATQVAPVGSLPATQKPRETRPELRSDRWRLDDPPTPVTHRAFRPGLPDLEACASSGWAATLARRARMPVSHDLSYANATGIPVLQAALLDHLRLSRGVTAEPHQIIIVPSAQAAFDIVTRAVITPGDVAWVEDPGYPGIRSVLRGAGARIVACPVDDQGFLPTPPGRTPPALIYVTPSHQYPTGATLPLSRRLEILSLAQQCGALVIEDDYDSEYQFRGQPVASLQGLDREGCVAYVGTFSKTLAPGVRTAFLVVPQRYAALAHTLAMASGQLVSVPLQLALADFLADGGLRRHLRKVTLEAGRRMNLLVHSLLALGDPRLHVPAPLGALQVCVGWSGQTSDVELVAQLAKRDISAVAVSPLCHSHVRAGLLLGIGLVKLDEIEPAVRRLGAVLAELP